MADILRTLDILDIDAKKNNLKLICAAGRKGLDRVIETRNINRPGLALGGFFDFFSYNCVQVFGRGEYNFIKKYKDDSYFANVREMLKYKIPCCIFSNGDYPADEFLKIADENDVPVLISKLSTSELVSFLFNILSDHFALKTTIHGVLVEIFGIGILILGKSGIGKSETALELIERGHRLIADDSIQLKAMQNKVVIGNGTKVISHHMEIRGVGIINVKNMYGVKAIKNKKRVHLVVELEKWDSTKEYERIGLDDRFYDVLGVKVPYLLIPVMPGRNIPIIIEAASMNHRLKIMGVNTAREFNKTLINFYETEEVKNSYFYRN